MDKVLIIIDLQNDYFDGGKFPLWNTGAVLSNIKKALEIVKNKDIPVVLVQHVADSSAGISPFFNEETDGVKIHSDILELVPNAKIVTKSYADSFYKTDLEKVLNELGAKELLICGMMTQNCVTHTAISKDAEKYNVTILSECCTTVNEAIHMIALHAVSTRIKLETIDNAF